MTNIELALNTLAEVATTEYSGADIRALSTTIKHEGATTGFDPQTGTLTLNFTPATPADGAVTAIEPGVPYIVKWPIPDDMTAEQFAAAYTAPPDAYEIHDPLFQGVTVTTGLNDVTFPGGAFKGTYGPTDIYSAAKDNLYLGAGNKLYYPWGEGMTEYYVNAFRAYFHVSGAAGVRQFVLRFVEDPLTEGGNFDGDGEAQGITTTDYTDFTDKAGAWYTIDGVKLDGKPTKKGLYIHGDRKVVIP